MPVISATRGVPQGTDIAIQSALPLVGSASRQDLQDVLNSTDAALARLHEDRNVLLTDGGLITFTGTDIQFTENIKLSLNSKVAGGAPTVVLLGSATVSLPSSGDIWYAVVNRTLGTATTSVASSLPAVTSANVEVFLIAKRVDSGDGIQRLYFRNGTALNAGQTVRLGASGSGTGGSGLGDDLNSVRFLASVTDSFSDANMVNTAAGFTDGALRSLVKEYFRLSYDATQTATTVGTAVTMSSAPTFTVKAGDVLRSGTQAKRITAVASQTSYTIESAFSSDLSSSACTVSQAVHTVDLRAFNDSSTGLAISDVISDSLSSFMLFYRDSSTINDTIWDESATPLISYQGSTDGTSFTAVQTRVSGGVDQTESVRSFPTSGTQARFRFFASATSGSGAVNLLDYKAFLHEEAYSTTGDALSQAYCLTDGSGTELNCSVSSSTGKTRIQTSWAYAVGINAGQTQGSIEVYLDGKLLPRYVDATITADASYTEVSDTIVELDSDYSGLGLSVLIKRVVGVVDTSNENASNINSLQQLVMAGTSNFVDESALLTPTTTTGTPATGTFHSTIVNRKSITNIAADLKARMGVERIPVQQLVELQNEFGPNGERVWGALNDDRNLIRFVGDWRLGANDSFGQYTQAISSSSSYLEITFYGTGLNILTWAGGTTYSAVYSINGSLPEVTFFPANPSASSVIGGRKYSPIQVLSVVSGQTTGLYTVKIRNTDTTNGLIIYGFEVLNEASTINVRPGTSYLNAKKVVKSAAESLAYNSGFDSILRDGTSVGSLGTKGARVLTYLKSDGTIGKAATAVNTSTSYLSSADHTYEDIIRTHRYNEFGASRTTFDDFSLMPTDNQNHAFTLEDGTTTLAGAAVNHSIANNWLEFHSGSSFLTLTFIGTGLDIIVGQNSHVSNLTVDGVAQTNLTVGSAGSGVFAKTKVVSGLPYGTHTVKIGPLVSGNIQFRQFVVYGPKKPSLPSAAIELADYNVMADYSLNTTLGGGQLHGTGTLSKTPGREFLYTGTWSTSLSTDYYDVSTTTSTNGSTASITFFGTGAILSATYGTSGSAVVRVDGSLYTGAATTSGSALISGTWNSGTSTWTLTGSQGSILAITGLPLGLHTISITVTQVGGFIMRGWEIITPIHSAQSNLYADLQNTLPVGSCALSDNRKTSAIKETLPAQKAWAQAVGVTTSASFTGSGFVPMPDMSATLKTNGGKVAVAYSAVYQMSGASSGNTQIYVNGVAASTYKSNGGITGVNASNSDFIIVNLPAGTHKFDVYWSSGGGSVTIQITNANRNLTVFEL